MKKIILEVIPHNKQRYDTVGDYWEDKDGCWQFRVSDMGDSDYELAVFVHELLEKALCAKAGIKDVDIDVFDMTYPGEGEPGDDKNAPYHLQHILATMLEKAWIRLNERDWDEYGRRVNNV